MQKLCTDLERITACVVHDHAYCEDILCFAEYLFVAVLAFKNPEFSKFRQILRHRIIKVKSAFFHKFCNGHSTESFGLGALRIHIVHGDRTLSGNIRITCTACFLNSILIEDVDGAGELTVIHPWLESIKGIGGARFDITA